MAQNKVGKVPRRNFSIRPLRKRFVISTEGKTEIQYFHLLSRLCQDVTIRGIRPGTQSAPHYVLKRMEAFIQREGGQIHTDRYWLVTDKNSWSEQQLRKLSDWSKTSENFGFAVSNPKFEYWLLLHFEDGYDVANSADVTRRLKRYLPNYDGSITEDTFTLECILQAVNRATKHDSLTCYDWPRKAGMTTVYRLVRMILESSELNNV